MLLACDTGGPPLVGGWVLDRGVAGALLADLGTQGRLKCVAGIRVVITDHASTGHPFLDEVLEEIAGSPVSRLPTDWVEELASLDWADRLGAARFPAASLPQATPRPRADIAGRLAQVFMPGFEPDPQTAALAALVFACGMSATLFPSVNRRARKRRLAELCAGQGWATAVREVIRAATAKETAIDLLGLILGG